MLKGEFPIQLRYTDMDFNRHVNGAAMIAFLEDGRIDLIRTLHPHMPPKCTWMVVRLEADYMGELHVPGTAVVHSEISKVGTSSVTWHQSIKDGGRDILKAVAVLVMVSFETRKPVPIPDAMRAILEA